MSRNFETQLHRAWSIDGDLEFRGVYKNVYSDEVVAYGPVVDEVTKVSRAAPSSEENHGFLVDIQIRVITEWEGTEE